MVCFDTNFLIDLIDKKKEAVEKLEQIVENNISIATTPICVAELYYGAYCCKNKDEEVNKVDKILETVEVLPLTKEAAKTYGRISKIREVKSSNPGDLDLLIASTALASNESLLTRNTKHFENIRGLRVETW